MLTLNYVKMRELSTLRFDDVKSSNITTDFLIKNFYEKYCVEYEIVTDKERQIKGIDSIFTLGDKKYFCDEKSAIRYVNKNLQTFSIELLFVNRKNELSFGWFLNPDYENNSYLFVWIDKALVNEKNLVKSTEDIIELEFAIVKKNKILDYLNKLGWTEEKLLRKSRLILNNDDEPLFNEKCPDIRFFYSKKLVEKPVNILLKRNKLIELSDFNLKITK